MTDTEKLRRRIDDSGLTLTYVARKIGLSRYGLYKKLNGISDFRQSEIKALVGLLDLTKTETTNIFFD